MGQHWIVLAGGPELLFQFIDDEELLAIARLVHRSRDAVEQDQVDHQVQVGRLLQLLFLDHDEVVGKIDGRRTIEVAAVGAVPAEGLQHHREVLQAAILRRAAIAQPPGRQHVADVGHRHAGAVRFPGNEDRAGDSLVGEGIEGLQR